RNQQQIGIRPNPVYDEFQISIPLEYSEAILEILNIQGQLVYQTSLITTDNAIEADFPPGLYFYTIRKQNQIIGSGKFVRM
ncbi:MAG TPA: T9SS type A sorting domain-containing protein, partial [Saprospiraceae bacterium]|nr:T9SS type A sorting domain-containing protein [Saprospiraceae bacterium]